MFGVGFFGFFFAALGKKKKGKLMGNRPVRNVVGAGRDRMKHLTSIIWGGGWILGQREENRAESTYRHCEWCPYETGVLDKGTGAELSVAEAFPHLGARGRGWRRALWLPSSVACSC